MSQVKLIKGRASSHIQVTATAMSVPLCAAFLPFEKSSPLPEREEERGKENLELAEVMLVFGTPCSPSHPLPLPTPDNMLPNTHTPSPFQVIDL